MLFKNSRKGLISYQVTFLNTFQIQMPKNIHKFLTVQTLSSHKQIEIVGKTVKIGTEKSFLSVGKYTSKQNQ